MFCNNPDAGDLGYAAINGEVIPDRFVETWQVPDDAVALIFATDGYPAILPTLEQTETYLAKDLRDDPLRIVRHASTKGLAPDQQSFDDRTYVRLQRC